MATKETSKARVGEMLYGAHPIIEMLKAKKRKLIALYTTKILPKSWDRLAPYLPKKVANIQYVSKDTLDRMAGTSDHNGIIAWVSPFQFVTTPFDPKKKPFILVLDAIQDVRNVGAILRSAYCMGIDGVVMCKSKSAQLSPAAFKAAAGLAEHLEIYQAASLKQALQDLKGAGYNLYMAVIKGTDIRSVQFKGPACLVIGNEAVGISAEIQKLGHAITIPQRTPDISYNASVAAGILMYAMTSKLQ